MIDDSYWSCQSDRVVNGWGEYTMPAFRVRHTEGYTTLMEETWRFED